MGQLPDTTQHENAFEIWNRGQFQHFSTSPFCNAGKFKMGFAKNFGQRQVIGSVPVALFAENLGLKGLTNLFLKSFMIFTNTQIKSFLKNHTECSIKARSSSSPARMGKSQTKEGIWVNSEKAGGQHSYSFAVLQRRRAKQSLLLGIPRLQSFILI